MPCHLIVGTSYIFGKDEMLRYTRQELLERSGYAVLSTSDMLTVQECLFSGDVSVMVVCQSLPREDVELIGRFQRDIHSRVPLLSMGGPAPDPVLNFSQIYDMRGGPEAFIAAVGSLSAASK